MLKLQRIKLKINYKTLDKEREFAYNVRMAQPYGMRLSPQLRGYFSPSGKGVHMVSHIELFTFCLVIIGIAGLAIKIIDIIMRLKKK